MSSSSSWLYMPLVLSLGSKLHSAPDWFSHLRVYHTRDITVPISRAVMNWQSWCFLATFWLDQRSSINGVRGLFWQKINFLPLVHFCLSWSLEPCKNTRKCPLSGVFAADNSHYDVADVILELETGSIVRSMCICCDSDIYESQVKRVKLRVMVIPVNADVVKFVKIIFQWSWYSFELSWSF